MEYGGSATVEHSYWNGELLVLALKTLEVPRKTHFEFYEWSLIAMAAIEFDSGGSDC